MARKNSRTQSTSKYGRAPGPRHRTASRKKDAPAPPATGYAKYDAEVTAEMFAGLRGELPLSIELCGRVVDNGFPCLGVVYRPQPGQLYCYQCGATADHERPEKRARPVRYVRADKMSETITEALNETGDMGHAVRRALALLREGRTK